MGGCLHYSLFLTGSALKEFEQVPRHLTDDLHLFSLEDMVRVKKRLLVPLLKDILKASLAHVASCEVRFTCDRCVPELSLTPQDLAWMFWTLPH